MSSTCWPTLGIPWWCLIGCIPRHTAAALATCAPTPSSSRPIWPHPRRRGGGRGRDPGDVVDYVRDNDLGTAALLAAVHRHRDRVGRLVLASSMVVYGEGAHHCGQHGLVR